MNIHQKLCELRKKVSYIQKTEQGAQGVSSSNVLAKVRPIMDELGILLIPSVSNAKTFPKKDYGKPESKELFTEVWMQFEWINSEEPTDKIISSWYSQGLDMGEKGIGKALTYGEKSFILKSLNIPTDKDDPDTFANRDFKPITDIQKKAIAKKCKDAGMSDDAVKGFAEKHGLAEKSKEDTDEFLNKIHDKIVSYLEE